MITFTEYQRKTRETAIYPEAGTGSQLALAYCGLGLGEVGEIQGKLKKVIRDSAGRLDAESRLKILGEMGDALWYLARLCDELGTDFDVVAHGNLAKLARRAEQGTLKGSGDDR